MANMSPSERIMLEHEIETCEREIKFQLIWVEHFKHARDAYGKQALRVAEDHLAEWTARLLKARGLK